MLDRREFLERIEALDERDRNHLREVIEMLIRCYGSGKDGQGVVLFSPDDSVMAQVMTLNCDDMEASRLVSSVNEYFLFLNTRDAPPKEQFN